MLILTIRTDKPQAELGLMESEHQLAYELWQADRQLAETIHLKICSLLEKNHKKLADIKGLICFQGPGSFTGLRIGITVGNALASGLDIPIVASMGESDWISAGLKRLLANDSDPLALPEYGAPVHITSPKK